MRLTEYRKKWVFNKVAKYSSHIGIPEKDVPKVVFSRMEVLGLPEELTAGRRTVTHRYLGLCFRRANMIFISVKRHTTFHALENTIVHELIHYRFRYLKHGRLFQDRISLIIKNEKKYPPKELYPEEIWTTEYARLGNASSGLEYSGTPYAKRVKCICEGCTNEPTTLLKITMPPASGCYCSQCASDLKWHGIASEVELKDA